jgi:uncharacterized protein (DUF39 family)
VSDEDILAPVVDYSKAYPERQSKVMCHVTYAQLKSGTVELEGKTVPTTPLSSYPRAKEIAETLKEWVSSGKFELTAPAARLPGADAKTAAKPMPDRPPRG